MPLSQPCQAAGHAEAAFIGMVIESSEISSQPYRTVKFLVRDVLSGTGGKSSIEIKTGRGGGDCGFPFQAGQDYVVYAYRNSEGLLQTGICSGTKLLKDAQADAAYFRQMAKAPDTASLTVATAIRGSQGAAGVAIVAAGAGTTYRSLTGADGNAEFLGILPGEYSIHSEAEGDLPDDPKVRVGAKGCVSTFRMGRLLLVGQVTTADGKPAPQIEVETRSVTGKSDSSYSTRPDGHFEIGIRTPGEYYVGVNLNHAATSYSPYPRWFYPGTGNMAQAEKFEFSGKSGTRTLNFQVPGTAARREVDGVVLTREGLPRERSMITVFDKTNTIVETGFADRDGRFRMSVFADTNYRVQTIWPGNTPEDAFSAPPAIVPEGKQPVHLRLVLTEPGNAMFPK